MDFFLPSDIARLVLGYLKENDYQKTYSCFLKECSDLQEYYRMLQAGREPQTTIMGFSLILILEEWSKQKNGNSPAVTSMNDCRNNRKKLSVIRNGKITCQAKPAVQPAISPLKQALSRAPLWSPNRSRPSGRLDEPQQTAEQAGTFQKEKGYPTLKTLLDVFGSKDQAPISILPLTPLSKGSDSPASSGSPLKATPLQAATPSVASLQTECFTENPCGQKTGISAKKEQLIPDTEDLTENGGIDDTDNVDAEIAGTTHTAATVADNPELPHTTPCKSAAQATVAIHHVTPVKLFEALVNTAQPGLTNTKSPRRKKPKTPRKRTSDVGSNSVSSHSGAEDVPEPQVFKKLLADNRLHEKLAQTCNTYLESRLKIPFLSSVSNNNSDKKDSSASHQDTQEQMDTVTHSRSLEEILDMDTNFVADLVSDNIDMSDPVYESLFKLFGKEKEAFYEELRQEKKTDEMAKEVEELEKSIQQEIEKTASEFNSPIHSIEQALPQLPNSMPSQRSSHIDSVQPVTSCQDNNPGSFLPSLGTEVGMSVHSTPNQRAAIINAVSSPSSVVTQPFSPTNCSQILSPVTPYHNQPFTPQPTSHSDDSTLHDHEGNTSKANSGTNGVMSPHPSGAVSLADMQPQTQSTPIRSKQVRIDPSLPSCSPLVKADLNPNSPVMVQRTDPFTPRSTYTPHTQKSIFTPKGTSRLLFSPPAQIVPECLSGQNYATVDNTTAITEFQQLTNSHPQYSSQSASLSVHEQSFVYNSDTNGNVIETAIQLETLFPMDSGVSPCLTIANSIGCISLPQEQEKPVGSRKSGKSSTAEGKRKPRSKKGVEEVLMPGNLACLQQLGGVSECLGDAQEDTRFQTGSATFATLKNLLSQPHANATSHLTMAPDLLMPADSPEAAQLSGEDVKQNIVLLSPGGTSYNIPVLDCHDEQGNQTEEGTDTVSLWEAGLNTSTQLAIRPENQVTHSLVNSIEQGDYAQVINQLQKKKTHKPTERKGERKEKTEKKSRRKKKKKGEEPAYFQSTINEVLNKNGFEDDDEIFIASPLMFSGQKTFIRNLDFGPKDGNFRKILPKPPTSSVITATNSVTSGSNVVSVFQSTEPNNITDLRSGNPGQMNEVKELCDIQSGPNTKSSCDLNSAKTVEEKLQNVAATSGNGPVLESYIDWKKNMKTKADKMNGNGNQSSTSTPLIVSDSSVDCGLTKKTTRDLTQSNTPPSDKKELTQIIKVSNEKNQNSSSKSEVRKSSTEQKQSQKAIIKSVTTKHSSNFKSVNKKETSKKYDEIVIDSSSDDSSCSASLAKVKDSVKKPTGKGRSLAKRSTQVLTTKQKASSTYKGSMWKVKFSSNKRKNVKGKDSKKNLNKMKNSSKTKIGSESSDDEIPLCQLKKKMDAMSPAYSVLSTPQKGSRSPLEEVCTPSKEELLEKVGLTPTKTMTIHAFRSPGQANPLDVLAEWQGSLQRKKRHSGPVTRNRLNILRKPGVKSPAKSPSSVRRKAASGKSSNNSLEKNYWKSNSKEKQMEIKQVKTSLKKSSEACVKRTPPKSLFSSPSEDNDRKQNNISADHDQEDFVRTVCNNSSEARTDKDDEETDTVCVPTNLQQALQCIEMDNIAASFIKDDNDSVNDYDPDSGLILETFERPISVVQVNQKDESIKESLNGKDKNNCIRETANLNLECNKTDKSANRNFDVCNSTEKPAQKKSEDNLVSESSDISVHDNSFEAATNRNCVENKTCEKNNEVHCNNSVSESHINSNINYSQSDDRTEVYENVSSDNSNKSREAPPGIMSIDCKGDNRPNISDTGIEVSVNDESLKLLSDEIAKRKEKKRRHKEKKRLRKLHETSKETGEDNSQHHSHHSHNHSNHHHHHHGHHHHHHSKHKKKKSKKRHRDEMDNSADNGKSKKQRLEVSASRALEAVDIDEALTKLYSMAVAAT